MTTTLRRLSAVAVMAAAGAALHGAPHADVQAPGWLSDTGLYAEGRAGRVDPRNRPFSPQYPLWTDGATKRRWVYLPPGQTIDVSDPDQWTFPVGTRFWKEFSFAGKPVETRLLWRATEARWVAATYIWNEDGTDAALAPPEGVRNVVEIAHGRRHSLPSATDCLACHGAARTRPLGFTALQLSPDRDSGAIHGEVLAPGMLTLAALADDGLLAPRRTEWAAAPPRIAASSPRARAALGYLAANCGACHARAEDVPAVAPFLPMRGLLTNADEVARAMVGRPTNWQAPGRDDATRLVDPSAPELSALLLRMRSRRPSSQMPPLGTVVQDDEAVALVERWIRELERVGM